MFGVGGVKELELLKISTNFSNYLLVKHSWQMVILDENMEAEGGFSPNAIFHVA